MLNHPPQVRRGIRSIQGRERDGRMTGHILITEQLDERLHRAILILVSSECLHDHLSRLSVPPIESKLQQNLVESPIVQRLQRASHRPAVELRVLEGTKLTNQRLAREW